VGLLSRIFGSSGTAAKVVDSAISGIDAVVFTKEEKAAANQKILDWYITYLKATQPQNLARRLIAVIVVMLWALMIFSAVIAEGFGLSAFSEFTFKVIAENVNTPFSIIIGFYFAAHAIRAMQKN
jgi:hypothetical protein